MDVARACNKYFNDQEPWRTLKENKSKCATTINICMQACHTLAVLMEPILPFSAEKLWSILGIAGLVHDQAWDEISSSQLVVGHKLGKVEILFQKMDKKLIQPEIERLKEISDGLKPQEGKVKEEKARISFDEFSKLELRVARVLQAEKVEKADKLLKLEVDLGDEKRTIVAGIAQHYSPEEMIDRKIVIVANLEPAKIRGIESNGMLLAAEDDDGHLSTLTVTDDIHAGAKVK